MPCRLMTHRQGQKVSVEGILQDVTSDGGTVASLEPLAAGMSLKLTIPGLLPTDLPMQVTGIQPQTTGYRLQLRLASGTWPYSLYSELLRRAMSHEENLTQTPSCLQEFGLTMPCTVKDLQQVFDDRVRRAHPDRGGSVEAFVRLRTAYRDALQFLRTGSLNGL